MPADPPRQSFWTTLPGILTGIAALVTAVTGLIVGVSQSGWLRSSAAPPAAGRAEGRAATAVASPPDEPPGREAAAPPARDAKQEGTVVITAQDGTVTTVYADSLEHRQQGRELYMLSGQRIPFDRIRTIEVTRVDSGQARVEVTLVNGTVHSGSIASGLFPFAFTGTNDLGTFEIRVEHLARLTFER